MTSRASVPCCDATSSEKACEVSGAADGTGMRGVPERNAIDLVLLDLMMPGEDGAAAR
jgi:DNA-binding response OmpR family regulator